MYDVVIIGAGVTGCSIARELSRYPLKTAVLEKEEDVCAGTSKANSGIVHAGFDAKPGSVKAVMNLRGSERMEELSKELDFPYRRNGSIVLCFQEEDIPRLEKLKAQGEVNGVKGLEILRGEAMKQLEPEISDEVVALLHAPTGGIVCPFKLTLAMAENANVNGVEFFFDEEVTAIEKTEKAFLIRAGKNTYETRLLVNAAGVYGDVWNNAVSERKLSITPRKGEYCLLDRKVGTLVDKTVFQLPTAYGKGVLVTPTVHGNLMIGPTAVDIEDKEDISTTGKGLSEVIKKARISVDKIPMGQTITSFSGLRAHEAGDDFVIGEAPDCPGFFNAVGIESPGLSAAPAIGECVAKLIAKKLNVQEKPDFIAARKDIVSIAHASKEEISALIEKNPAYGNVICRCETVTEGEIMDAIHRPLGARSLDGVKRRTRAGMGRCQSGFCAPKTMEILARELKVSPLTITKAGKASRLLSGQVKEDI